jgi:hypothetical protein
MNPLFIYTKSGDVKCLGLNDRETHQYLLDTGWMLSSSIDPGAWIEHLIKNRANAQKLIDELLNNKPPAHS